MKNTTRLELPSYALRTAGIAAAILAAGVALPAFAQGVNVSANATVTTDVTAPAPTALGERHLLGDGASSTARADLRASTTATRETNQADAIAKAKADAASAITMRIDSLNKLLGKIQAMVHVSATDKSAIEATVNGQISDLTTLNATIAADTSTTTLKTDVQSITKGYRIYMLVMPQITILAAADRGSSIADMLTTVGTKIQARISGQADANTFTITLSDLNAKAADAKVQGQAAITETATLTPDNGDATVAASNTAALKDARSKIQVAQQDLKAAQQDAMQLIQALKGTAKASANASTTASVSQ